MFENGQFDSEDQSFQDCLMIDLLKSKKKIVMVIDDDQDFRLSVSELLVEEGYHVTTAKDGEVALHNLVHRIDIPDLILVDLMMPVKNGIQFRREQLALERIGDIPVLFISGHGIVEGELNLQKPLDSHDFLQTIKDILKKREN
jgi:CheY-like chemotaxis protein